MGRNNRDFALKMLFINNVIIIWASIHEENTAIFRLVALNSQMIQNSTLVYQKNKPLNPLITFAFYIHYSFPAIQTLQRQEIKWQLAK